MVSVLIPVAVLLFIVLCKKLPKIGGNVQVALVVAGILSLLLGKVFAPADWVAAFIDGLNRLAWIIFLSIFGSIYAETQSRLGVIDTIMGALKAKFGKFPRALVVSIILVLVLAGSLLGDAIAAGTVVGVLTVGTLAAMGLAPEYICCIIVMGASMGSIMPPITQAMALSSSLVGVDADPVLRMGYVTVSIVIILVCLYVVFFFIKKNMRPDRKVPGMSGADRYDGMKAGQILKSNWKALIPLIVLIIIVLLRTVKIGGSTFDLGPTILKNIKFGSGEDAPTLYSWLASTTILTGLTNGIVLSLLIVTVLACCFKRIRGDVGGVIKSGLGKVKTTVSIQVCAAFMLGCFYAGGQIDAVANFAVGLNSNVLKLGGAAAMMLIGMLTGSQSTAQNVVFSFFGPALVSTGLNATHVALAGAHLAASGQGMPPADLTTFVVAGIVGGMLGRKVDPLKSMILMIPMCIGFLAVGLLFLYI
ncbi:MAG: TRAP transporter large permease subunit [Lachnospiraceae bacterium]|nr:TRAP transporter large permease subunit [Lachnospiraceae bacterium]